MKAFFVFRDGELVGSPVGYTTEKGALKSLVGCEDWYKLLRKYEKYHGKTNCPQELIDSKIYSQSSFTDICLFEREVWSRKIWTPYVKEHYKIVEKEFDIVFKD